MVVPCDHHRYGGGPDGTSWQRALQPPEDRWTRVGANDGQLPTRRALPQVGLLLGPRPGQATGNPHREVLLAR